VWKRLSARITLCYRKIDVPSLRHSCAGPFPFTKRGLTT
jgi:hypothetical protein